MCTASGGLCWMKLNWDGNVASTKQLYTRAAWKNLLVLKLRLSSLFISWLIMTDVRREPRKMCCWWCGCSDSDIIPRSSMSLDVAVAHQWVSLLTTSPARKSTTCSVRRSSSSSSSLVMMRTVRGRRAMSVCQTTADVITVTTNCMTSRRGVDDATETRRRRPTLDEMFCTQCSTLNKSSPRSITDPAQPSVSFSESAKKQLSQSASRFKRF